MGAPRSKPLPLYLRSTSISALTLFICLELWRSLGRCPSKSLIVALCDLRWKCTCSASSPTKKPETVTKKVEPLSQPWAQCEMSPPDKPWVKRPNVLVTHEIEIDPIHTKSRCCASYQWNLRRRGTGPSWQSKHSCVLN